MAIDVLSAAPPQIDERRIKASNLQRPRRPEPNPYALASPRRLSSQVPAIFSLV